MWKALMVLLAFTTPTFAEDSVEVVRAKMNTSNMNFNKSVSEHTIEVFYEVGIDEYQYSNFGFARDIFTAITQQTNSHPGAYFFLGKIYEEVAVFKNIELSKQCYLNAAINKTLAATIRQQSYLALIRLTENPEVAIKYAQSSSQIASSDLAKQGLILAYHKKYEKTGDETLLGKAEDLTKQMNQRYFDGSVFTESQNAAEQVNLVKP